MRWERVFGLIPTPVFYTDDLPEDVGGCVAYWVVPIVKIRPKYQADEGILQHELQHCRQFWAITLLLAIVNVPVAAILHLQWGVTWGYGVTASWVASLALMAFPLMYTFSPMTRLWAEASAYRVQMQFPDRDGHRLTLDEAVQRLMSPRYNLNLDPETARDAIELAR